MVFELLMFVAVSETVKLPICWSYVWVGFCIALVVLSPKFQFHDVAQVERSVKATVNGSVPATGEPLKSATGAVVLNVAVIVVSALIVMVHVPFPEHPPPLHPIKVEHVPAWAVRVMIVPSVYASVQSVLLISQFMPDGLLVTEPPPVPVLETVRVYCGTTPVPVNDASTVGVSGSFDGIESVAVFAPAEVGLNVICIWHVPDAGRVMPVHVSVCFVNSDGFVPVIVVVPMMRSPVPMFVI